MSNRKNGPKWCFLSKPYACNTAIPQRRLQNNLLNKLGGGFFTQNAHTRTSLAISSCIMHLQGKVWLYRLSHWAYLLEVLCWCNHSFCWEIGRVDTDAIKGDLENFCLTLFWLQKRFDWSLNIPMVHMTHKYLLWLWTKVMVHLLIHNLFFRLYTHWVSKLKRKKPVIRDLGYVSAFLYVTHSITLVWDVHSTLFHSEM